MVTKQKGVGLIEVMVTLVILSVGLLGIASLQATGIQAGQGASLRTAALLVVEDITSRMKANKIGVYNTVTAVSSYGSNAADAGTDNGCNDAIGGVVANTCTPIQMARHDIFVWKTNLANALPSATGAIVTSVAAPASEGFVTVTITVTWKEKGTVKSYENVFKMKTV